MRFQIQIQTNCSWFEKTLLHADPRAIQQIVFQDVAGGDDDVKLRLSTILEKSKERVLEFYKGSAKVLWEYINGWIQ